jgi:hypothetical protein
MELQVCTSTPGLLEILFYVIKKVSKWERYMKTCSPFTASKGEGKGHLTYDDQVFLG